MRCFDGFRTWWFVLLTWKRYSGFVLYFFTTGCTCQTWCITLQAIWLHSGSTSKVICFDFLMVYPVQLHLPPYQTIEMWSLCNCMRFAKPTFLSYFPLLPSPLALYQFTNCFLLIYCLKASGSFIFCKIKSGFGSVIEKRVLCCSHIKTIWKCNTDQFFFTNCFGLSFFFPENTST